MVPKREGGGGGGGGRGHSYSRHGGRVNGLFNPIEWGNGYTEGNAWHHSFPPYAVTDYPGCSAASLKLKDQKQKASGELSLAASFYVLKLMRLAHAAFVRDD